MSIDFDKYPHLVSKIEVFNIDPEGFRSSHPEVVKTLEDLDRENERTSSSTIYNSYFRYIDPTTSAVVFDGVIEGNDENHYMTVEHWNRHILKISYQLGDIALSGNGFSEGYLVADRPGDISWDQHVRRAVAATLGYEEGLVALKLDHKRNPLAAVKPLMPYKLPRGEAA